jgi:hypothetical protein
MPRVVRFDLEVDQRLGGDKDRANVDFTKGVSGAAPTWAKIAGVPIERQPVAPGDVEEPSAEKGADRAAQAVTRLGSCRVAQGT